MHCTNDIRKVVKSHGDTITSYAGYSKRNFKKGHLTSLGSFSASVKIFFTSLAVWTFALSKFSPLFII